MLGGDSLGLWLSVKKMKQKLLSLASEKGPYKGELTCITYNHREDPAGLIACYFLVERRIIQLQALKECHKTFPTRPLQDIQEDPCTYNTRECLAQCIRDRQVCKGQIGVPTY